MWGWDERCESSLNRLKDALVSAPVLRHFEDGLETEVHNDASSVGFGAVLIQKSKERESVVSYASRRTFDVESCYSATELECRAVLWAFNEFRTFIYGQPITIVTDNAAMSYLRKKVAVNQRIPKVDVGT